MYYRTPELMFLSVFYYPLKRFPLLFSTKKTCVTKLKPAWITQHNESPHLNVLNLMHLGLHSNCM